jgi:hypothetical protein
MEGMIRRLLDWGSYLGIACWPRAILPFTSGTRTGGSSCRRRPAVLVSCLPGSRTIAGSSAGVMKYGLTAVAVAGAGRDGRGQALSFRHSARWDLTENKRFSVAADHQLLSSLKTNVSAVAFFRDQPGKRVAEDLLTVRPLFERQVLKRPARP